MAASKQAQHVLRKVQSVARKGHLPADLLSPAGLETRFCGATGFPEAADSVAFDPIQGLLAVGTSDGRVVLIGRPGVQATLRSASRSPTQHLCFLPNRGALLRVTQDGDIQLFSAVHRKLLTSTWLQGDVINSVTLLPGAADPYILLGCESGNVRIVELLDGEGQPAVGARPAADLALQPYQVLGQEVGGRDGVVAVAVATLRDRPLLLLVHRDSGAIVWDIRAERILCAALDEEEAAAGASKPTCACWVGERANCFAVGYDDGSVMVWGVPAEALQADPFKVVEPPDAELLMPLRLVAGRGTQASPVRSLSFLPASSGAPAAAPIGASAVRGPGAGAWVPGDCLLVFGGQGKGEPDMLTLLPLEAQAAGDGGGRQVPWFGSIKGFCEMPADAAAALNPADHSRPRGLMILTEGGQLVVHDLKQWQPTPLTLPVQELPPITVAKLVPTVSLAMLRDSGAAGGSAAVSPRPGSGLPSPSPRGGEAPGAGSVASSPQQLHGAPAALPQHGLTLERVRACSRRGGQPASEHALPEHWPFTGGLPASSLAAAGGGEGGASSGRHPSALLFSGHRDGRVRVWDATMQVPELLLTVPAAAGQERLRAVTAMEVDPFSGILMVGHAGGDARLYQFSDSQQSVHRMNIDEAKIPYENVGQQPPGFQYILRYSTHSADISSVALATKLKLAAVADESGNLSLVDLLQPAQLFSTRVMPQAVAQAVFGSHVFPGAKDEPGVERVVLFLAGADSSVCMVGLDRGEHIGHTMRPKNTSRPLSLAALDASGFPLPLLHGQLLLAWANNNSPAPAGPRALGAAVAAAAGARPAVSGGAKAVEGRLSRISLSERASSAQSPLPPTGSRRSTAGESVRSWSRADSETADAEREGSVEVHELPSDDELDSHLAAAVQAAEEDKKQRGSKFKLPKAFRAVKTQQGAGGAAPRASDAEASMSPTSSDAASGLGQARSGEAPAPAPAAPAAAPVGAFDPVGALQGFYGEGGASEDEEDAPGLGARRCENGAAAADGQLLSPADLVDYQYLVDGDPSPASYLVLCCADYLRIYSTDNIRLGDRSTERKASFEAPLCFAAPFMSTHGPGIASVDTSDALQVHSLPGLELLCRKQLEDSRVLGFRWQCSVASAGGGPAIAGAACCSMDGQLLLVGAGNEIARLAVVEDCALPAPPACVYSMQAAQAAAAGRRPRSSYTGLRVEPPAGGSAGVQPQAGGGPEAAPAAEPGFSPLSAAAAAGKGFGRLLDHAAVTVTGLAATAADTVTQELQRLGGLGEGGPSRPLPSLATLFAIPVEPIEDIDYMLESEESPGTAGPSPTVPGAQGAAAGAGAEANIRQGGAAMAAARKLGASVVSPREAAAKLKHLLPGRSKSERAELLESHAAAADGAGTSGPGGSVSARGAPPAAAAGAAGGAAGGSSYWAAAGKVAPYNRTASEIKSAYGRGASSKAGDVKGIMEQNRAMLAERGERLRQLDEKSAAMSNDAEDFASLAKRLADQQAARKWYEF